MSIEGRACVINLAISILMFVLLHAAGSPWWLYLVVWVYSYVHGVLMVVVNQPYLPPAALAALKAAREQAMAQRKEEDEGLL